MIKKSLLVTVSGTVVFLILMSGITMAHGFKPEAESGKTIKLPEPRIDGEMSVERALQKRRSIREYRDDPLTLK
ncbi:MAG: nitroreductase, partial [Proteobacteria bacterium]|nr:nitroreductase [Pseudomonadota bacterium]